MSSTGMTWARSQTAPSATCKAILILLGELSDDTGRVFRDQQHIADILQLSREAVLRNLARLEDAGMIRREPRFTEDRRRRTDIIRLQIGRRFTVENPCDPGSPGEEESRVILSQEPCDSGSHNGVIEDHSKNKQELKQELTTNNPALYAPEGAEAISIQDVCKRIHDGTNGAWSFKEALGPVKWAVGAGHDPQAVLDMSARIWKSGGRVLTKAVLQQAFEGIAVPGIRQPQVRIPTSEINARQNEALKRQILNPIGELER